uniref:Uncharacterized protein n=1 Tax=Geospiza parvula TaxID=87175 RepID=A0A8C3Q751_GEOPR
PPSCHQLLGVGSILSAGLGHTAVEPGLVCPVTQSAGMSGSLCSWICLHPGECWHNSEHLEASLAFYCWLPHRAGLSKEQKLSFPQLGLGTHEVQLGSSQPNKAIKSGLITAEPSLPTEMLFTSLLCGQWDQSDQLWARILCGIRRLKEYYETASCWTSCAHKNQAG